MWCKFEFKSHYINYGFEFNADIVDDGRISVSYGSHN